MYAPDRDQGLRWMQRAIGLATLCPPAAGAYSVGAVIVVADHFREADSHENRSVSNPLLRSC